MLLWIHFDWTLQLNYLSAPGDLGPSSSNMYRRYNNIIIIYFGIKRFKWIQVNFLQSILSVHAVVDPGPPPRGRQLPTNLLFDNIFCRKLIENERNWAPREGVCRLYLAPRNQLKVPDFLRFDAAFQQTVFTYRQTDIHHRQNSIASEPSARRQCNERACPQHTNLPDFPIKL